MGRKKHLFKEKQRGRNELIADWIEMATGQSRNRKQVSSHIQVLKPFVAHDPLIMAYLSKGPDPESLMRCRHPSSHAGGRGLSRYPVQAPPQSGRHVLPLPAFGLPGRHGKLRDIPDIFEPVDFEMFVQRELPTVNNLRDEMPVNAPHGGIVVEWLVEDGDPVSPGQPLLRLHPIVESADATEVTR